MSATGRGTGLVELLVAAVLAMTVLALLTAAVGAGARLLAQAGRRSEAEDTAQLALETLLFDVRRAGYDPQATGVEPLAAADTGRMTLQADLDGDGTVDTASGETTAWVCNLAALRLSRLIGRQSMPLADDVTVCAFRYLDAAGAPLVIPPGGLAAADRARVRSITLTLALAPAGLARPTTRDAQVALRATP